jgi:hypothetical protein
MGLSIGNPVIPAKTGIHYGFAESKGAASHSAAVVDPGFRGVTMRRTMMGKRHFLNGKRQASMETALTLMECIL